MDEHVNTSSHKMTKRALLGNVDGTGDEDIEDGG